MAADMRPRPGPGRIEPEEPAAPVERRGSALPALPGASGGTVGTGERRRVAPTRRNKLRRALRGRRKWAVVAVAAVAALVIGLLGSGFLSEPAPPVDSSAPNGADGSDDLGLAPTTGASTTRAAAASSGAGTPATGGDIKDLLENKFDNPLNNLRDPGYHQVTVTARSSERMSIVGYLVPTGSDAYGSRSKTASFTLTQRAYGPGYLAAVFIQAGQSGAPVTCTVTVDGKTTNTEATSGPYGRAVCVG